MTATLLSTPSRRLVGALVAVVVAVAASLWWFVARSAAETEVAGTGRVTVADEVYDFELTTCTAAEADFVAAGFSTVDGERYWLNATGGGVDITAGTESEIEPPIVGRFWLSSNGAPEWRMIDGVVAAEVGLTDRRIPGAATNVAVLELSCDEHVSVDA